MHQNKITITDIRDEDIVEAVANVHTEAFAGYLNTRFGRRYTTSSINWFAHSNQGIALTAVDRRQQVMGYALGIPSGHGQAMYRELRGVLVHSVMLKPWLLLDFRLWLAAGSRFKRLYTENSSDRADLSEPIMALVSIGVSSQYQKQGVGVQLMNIFEERAKTLKMRSLIAWVYKDNTRARRLYEKCGWQSQSDSLTQRGSLRYYKMISD